jgi:hypothetical protein
MPHNLKIEITRLKFQVPSLKVFVLNVPYSSIKHRATSTWLSIIDYWVQASITNVEDSSTLKMNVDQNLWKKGFIAKTLIPTFFSFSFPFPPFKAPRFLIQVAGLKI